MKETTEAVNYTEDQSNSLALLSESVMKIKRNLDDQSVSGIITSRDAGQIWEATNRMANIVRSSILDEEVSISDDLKVFVRDTINLVLSTFMVYASLETLRELAENIASLAKNFSAALGGEPEISRAADSMLISIATRNSFQMLTARSERLIRFFERIENQARLAPRVADHMLQAIHRNIG